jgi:hypothetical protein
MFGLQWPWDEGSYAGRYLGGMVFQVITVMGPGGKITTKQAVTIFQRKDLP